MCGPLLATTRAVLPWQAWCMSGGGWGKEPQCPGGLGEGSQQICSMPGSLVYLGTHLHILWDSDTPKHTVVITA